MAENIAELIDKNAEQAESLCDVLTPCQEHLAELKSLLERAIAQSDEVNQAISESRELLTALAGLKEKIETAREITSAGSTAWEECLETASQNLTSVFDSADTAVTELTELSVSVETTWDEKQSEAMAALADVAIGVESLSQQVETDRDGSHGVIGELKTSVEGAVGRFEQLREGLNAALDGLQATADEGTEDFAENLQKWSQSGAELYGSVSESVTTAVTASTGSLESAWQEGVVGVLGEATEGLLSQFSEGTEVVEEVGEQLDGKVGDVIDKIGKVLDMIEEIKPVLDKVQDLLE